MIAFSSAIEPLRMANRDAGRELYRWTVFTIDGLPERASNGLEITPDASIENANDVSILFVCSGDDVADAWSRQLQFALRRIAKRSNVKLGALCTGSYLLARAGLLDGYKCTIHWENIASLREEFPEVLVSDDLFVIDRDRITSAQYERLQQLVSNALSQELHTAAEQLEQLVHATLPCFDEPFQMTRF